VRRNRLESHHLYYGIPSSSSHALVGGIIGAGVAKAGVSKLVASGVLKTAAAIVVSPLFGFMLAIALMIAVSWIFARSTPGAWTAGSGGCSSSRLRSTVSDTAATMRKNHGHHLDAAHRVRTFSRKRAAAFLVVLACQAAMGLGTLFGGWRIVKTMGMRITKLKPVGGFLRFGERCDDAVSRHEPRHSGVHDPHHHRLDHRRGLDAEALRGALGRGRQHHLGVDLHHPGLGVHRRVAWLLGTEYF